METSSVSYRGAILTLDDDIAEVDGEGGGGVASMANLEFLDSLRESSVGQAGQAGQNSGIQQTSSCGCGCGGGDDGCGSGCGCGSGSGLIMSARISQGEQTLEMNGCDAGTTNYKLSSCHIPNGFTFITENKIYALQGGNSTVFHADFSYHQCGPGRVFIQGAEGVEVEDYWNQNVASVNSSVQAAFSWSLPTGVSNEDAARDFTFNYHVDKNNDGIVDPNEDCWSVDVHIGYAEVLVSFGGNTDPAVLNVSANDVHTRENSVIVGEQVVATLSVDPVMTLKNPLWLPPTGGDLVKDFQMEYVPLNEQSNEMVAKEGKIILHTPDDYEEEEFRYYYAGKGDSGIGGISNSLVLVDPNGVEHTVTVASSFFIDSPTVTRFISKWATWPGSNDPPVGVKKYKKNEHDHFMLGGIGGGSETEEGVFRPGIAWAANVTPLQYGGGEIAFCQLTNRDWNLFLDDVLIIKASTNDEYMLDNTFPYGGLIEDVANPLYGADSPGCALDNTLNKYTVTASFKDYLIYKPTGDSIWVSLAVMDWGWTGEATYDGVKWTGSGTTFGGTSSLTTELPVWTDNAVFHGLVRVT